MNASRDKTKGRARRIAPPAPSHMPYALAEAFSLKERTALREATQVQPG